MLSAGFHTPVMCGEVLEYLNLSPGKLIVDATVGTGGHTERILERILPGGGLIGIDRDESSLSIAKKRLERFGSASQLIQGNFSDLDLLLEKLNVRSVDGILFDLGISSYQLQDPARGFSFQKEGPLICAWIKKVISAYDLVNNLNEEELEPQELWPGEMA